jgi:hypothetical protein
MDLETMTDLVMDWVAGWSSETDWVMTMETVSGSMTAG